MSIIQQISEIDKSRSQNFVWLSISIEIWFLSAKNLRNEIAEKEQGMFCHSLGAISVLPDTF